MTEIQTALLESYRHWEDNVKSYPGEADVGEKQTWFMVNCQRAECSLCHVIGRSCKGCPLETTGSVCAKEWVVLADAILDGYSRLHHVEAMCNRLKTECEKEGLI